MRKIQKFLALARQNIPFLEAAQRVGLPFEVIETLAIMGLQAVPSQQYPERIIPQFPSTNLQTETVNDNHIFLFTGTYAIALRYKFNWLRSLG